VIRTAAPFVVLGLLGGCADHGSTVSQVHLRALQARMDDMKCRSYGAQPDGQDCARCRAQLGMLHQQQARVAVMAGTTVPPTREQPGDLR
jgi:hypothetical protein